uniref:Immunoglobulin V-set domain-containing protein n=1 Tax=Denticeps clupeoides TaxID=299321 RepID=A0AAY4D0R2_9TELE
MLGILCTLITALAGEICLLYASSCSFPGISGVTVVTQSPPDLTKRQMVTMDCNLGTVIDRGAWWYKQVPGGIPQFVLFFYHTNSAPTYGSGFSSPKFTSKHTSKSDYSLIINDVEVGDSAVYYCKTWDDSAKEYVSQ